MGLSRFKTTKKDFRSQPRSHQRSHQSSQQEEAAKCVRHFELIRRHERSRTRRSLGGAASHATSSWRTPSRALAPREAAPR